MQEDREEIKRQVREKITTYIGGGLGLVAGLAWNEAISTSIDHLFPLGKDTIAAKFIYALILTIVVVVITMYLTRILNRKKPE